MTNGTELIDTTSRIGSEAERATKGDAKNGVTRDQLVEKAKLMLTARDAHEVISYLQAEFACDDAEEIVAHAKRNREANVRAGEEHRTDAGNADRLVGEHGDRIRNVYERDPVGNRGWLSWNGKCWAPDRTGDVQRYAKATVRRMYADASNIRDESDRKAAAKHALSSESAGRLEAMVKLARTDERIVVREGDLDVDPWNLNVSNGTVNLRTGAIHEHRPEEMHSKVTSAAYVPGGQAPAWTRFLERVLPDADVREFVQKLVGYSLSGDVGENVLPFTYGSGANGKSVFLGVLREVLGDYATEAAPDLLVERRERGIPVDVADLRGYRFVTTTEVEGGRRMASDIMKRITGEPRLKARRMRQDFESFVNVTKLWMAANDRPAVDGLDEALWRRIRLIPFDVTIPPAERDPDLLRKLLDERDGILTWAVEGSVAYTRDGLTPPDAVRLATSDYRTDSNPLLDWIDAECELDAEASTPVAELRKSYERYCTRSRTKQIPGRSAKWTAALTEVGCVPGRTAAGRYWTGIKLNHSEGGGFPV